MVDMHSENAAVNEEDILYSDVMYDVTQFLNKFDIGYNGKPRLLPGNLMEGRLRHIYEELREYSTAALNGDKAAMYDALIDSIYLLVGNIILHGFDFYEGWDRVHAANISKERLSSKDGMKQGIIKPPGWEAPDLRDLVGE